jgi:hypothetical protein
MAAPVALDHGLVVEMEPVTVEHDPGPPGLLGPYQGI